jgi:hypothetical protein
MKYDYDGNLMTAHYDVRGGIVTANATLTTGTATSLIAGDADYMLDLVEMTFSTGSTVALGTATFGVDLINDGTVVRHFDMFDGGVEQVVFDPPLPQITKGTPWNLDMDDVTGTTLKVGATLSKRRK